MALRQLTWDSPPHTRHGPHAVVMDGAHRLWRFRGEKPPWPSSLLLYAPVPPSGVGVVHEVSSPTQVQSKDCDVFITGGVDYRCEDGSWEHTALVAAGYPFREVLDGYGAVPYGSPSPETEGYGSPMGG